MQQVSPLISKPAGYQSVHTTNPNAQYPVRYNDCSSKKNRTQDFILLSRSFKHNWVLTTPVTIICQDQTTMLDWPCALFSAVCVGQLSFVLLLL